MKKYEEKETGRFGLENTKVFILYLIFFFSHAKKTCQPLTTIDSHMT
jgi:hypothetical protein